MMADTSSGPPSISSREFSYSWHGIVKIPFSELLRRLERSYGGTEAAATMTVGNL
jgi:hypothetical protein